MDLSAAGFGASLTDALPDLRAMAESLMTLTLTAYAPDIAKVDGIEQPVFTPMGATFGKLQGGAASTRDFVSRTIQIGGVSRPVLEGGLHLPLSAYVSDGSLQIVAGDQGIGWEFEVTGVGSMDDPALTGRRFLVASVPAKSYATARRLDVAEVTLREAS